MLCIMHCDHMTITADHNDKIRELFAHEHYARDIDICDREEYEYIEYGDTEILRELGREDLLFENNEWISPDVPDYNDGDAP